MGGPLDCELFPHQGLRHGVRLILRKRGPERWKEKEGVKETETAVFCRKIFL